MKENKNNKVWSMLNSPLIIWLLSSVFVSLAIWIFEQSWSERNRQDLLRQKVARIEYEIEGRLAQYASWYELITLNDKDSSNYRFQEWISSKKLYQSIKLLGATPQDGYTPKNEDEFIEIPIIYSLYPEFSKQSLIGLFIEQITIYEELYPLYLSEEFDMRRDSTIQSRINTSVNSINAIYNPEIDFRIDFESSNLPDAEKFREIFNSIFESEGPLNLYFSEGLGM